MLTDPRAFLLSCSLFAEGSRQGHFFGFAFFTADFLAPFFTLLFEKPGRSFTRVTAANCASTD